MYTDYRYSYTLILIQNILNIIQHQKRSPTKDERSAHDKQFIWIRHDATLHGASIEANANANSSTHIGFALNANILNIN